MNAIFEIVFACICWVFAVTYEYITNGRVPVWARVIVAMLASAVLTAIIWGFVLLFILFNKAEQK